MKIFQVLLISLYTLCSIPAYSNVVSFSLINSDTDQEIGIINDGDVIDLSTLSTQNLNIRANTQGNIGSVVFDFNSTTNYTTENVAPYALEGDSNGDYNNWTPGSGSYYLKASAYSMSNGAGTLLGFAEINFQVSIDNGPGNTGNPVPLGISGELKKWHKITLTFQGPSTSEFENVNPFLDYRLDVTFSKGSKSYVVPGYYAADGQAHETSANVGDRWQVHFRPDETGIWQYQASFRTGPNVAIETNINAGQSASFDGQNGYFTVAPSDKTGIDLRSKGRLEYVGQRYLKFVDGGYFIKVGADAPENFLAYDDFDNTPNYGNRRKSWSPHIGDWNTNDPTWQNGKGKGIIGAVNYLSNQGQNVFSFLTMNINGDDRNVFPYVSENDRERMDISKMAQWEIVFEHADEMGMYLHFKTQETENDNLLDGGALGTERKLYYRELIARFGHHLALNWNLGEENTNTTQQRKEFAQYIDEVDPYPNNIVIHTYPSQDDQVYTPLLGESDYTGASLQVGWSSVHGRTLEWINKSNAAGKPWVVANDEQGGANTGIPHDAYTGSPSQDDVREKVLWGNLMAGGAGLEYYFGYSLPHSDLTCEDFRSRSIVWGYNKIAKDFFYDHLPFWQMESHDNLTSNGGDYCLADIGEIYAVYISSGGTANIDLPNDGETYNINWFDPRNGGNLRQGSLQSVTGTGSTLNIGNAPSNSQEDWVALIRSSDIVLPVELTSFTATPVNNKRVKLSWETSMEKNNDYFILESSIDAENFRSLGIIQGAGDSEVPQYYSFVDSLPSRGANYYRLKQVDFDGTFTFSDIALATITNNSSKLLLYPNPAFDRLFVQVPETVEGDVIFTIYNSDGKIIKQFSRAGFLQSVHELPIGDIISGIYTLKVRSRHHLEMQRFIIMNLE